MILGSLRARLLGWLLLPLTVFVCISGIMSVQNARSTANILQDGALMSSMRIIGEDIDWDNGEIVVMDSPEALKASVGADRVSITTSDDEAAIRVLRDRFAIEAKRSEGVVSFHVAGGEHFIPRLFADLGLPILSVNVARPTLDDVFMSLTGHGA